ncbi:MAG TPA: methionyl-tRNA formyltransferase, partial [Bacillota bacterium]
ASLLPRHRGAAPIQHALLNGDTETGITVFYMDEGMDTGDILHQRPLAIEPDDTFGSLHARLSRLAAEALPEALRLLVSDQPPRLPQDHGRATYAPRLEPADERVRWDEPVVRVAGRIRALDPVPGAVTTWRGRPLKLYGARPAQDVQPPAGTAPGTVLAADAAAGLVIAAADGAVAVAEVQGAGGRRMPVGDFLNGRDLRPGEVLGAAPVGAQA